MAVKEEQTVEEVKELYLDAKKRASDLQREIDNQAKERKTFQDIEAGSEKARTALGDARKQIGQLEARVKELEAAAASGSKALGKAEAKVAAAEKIAEGLAALSK